MLYKILYKLALIYWWIFRPVTVGARVLFIKDNKILLVKHTYRNNWFPPGGGVKRNEALEGTAMRECQEEVGTSINKDDLILVDVIPNFGEGRRDYVAVYTCNRFSAIDKKNIEIKDAKWFGLDDLPSDLHRVWKKEIEKLMRLEKL